jgi:hypothetical protein
MNKKTLLALTASLGMLAGMGAQADTLTGTVTGLNSDVSGVTRFKLDTSGTWFYIFSPAVDSSLFYDEATHASMIARINTAYIKGNSTTITYTAANCGWGNTCPTNIK